jgi:DNA-binding transcriptional LysR family regulator
VMLHEYVVEDKIRDGKLVEILKEFMQTEIPIYLAYPKKRFISRATRCFIDFFLDKLNKEKAK